MIAATPRSGDGSVTAAPRRFARSRRKDAPRGYQLGRVYIGRPSLWANPFLSDRFGHARSVDLHRTWLAGRLPPRRLAVLGFNLCEIDALFRLRRRVLINLPRLAGLNLECWCAPGARFCHGDTLLALANSDQPAGITPTGSPNSDAPAAATAGVSVTRPVGALRSGRHLPGPGA